MAGWRLPFLLVALPTLALTCLMLYLVEEPQAGQADALIQHANVKYKEKITWTKAKQVVMIPSNILMILQVGE